MNTPARTLPTGSSGEGAPNVRRLRVRFAASSIVLCAWLLILLLIALRVL